jgi:hypothetical protein
VEGGEGRFFLNFSKLTLGFCHHHAQISTFIVVIPIKIFEKLSYFLIEIKKKLRVLINLDLDQDLLV